jgi:formylmethanofuran dehydrogenase subunit E
VALDIIAFDLHLPVLAVLGALEDDLVYVGHVCPLCSIGSALAFVAACRLRRSTGD